MKCNANHALKRKKEKDETSFSPSNRAVKKGMN